MKVAFQVGMAVMSVTAMSYAAPALAAAAYIDHVYPPGQQTGRAIRIRRAGKDLNIRIQQPDLEDGDEVYVIPFSEQPQRHISERMVTIRYYVNNVIVPVGRLVRQDGQLTDHYVVRAPRVPGVYGGALALLKALMRSTGGGETMAASKGMSSGRTCFNTTGRTNQPIEFTLPGLTVDMPRLVGGRRMLAITWRGGSPPYMVRLYRANAVAPLVESGPVNKSCSTKLPVDLAPDRYRLIVEDHNGVRLEENNLLVTSTAPTPPKVLRDASLGVEGGQLYRATWLSLVDRGTWAFEAQQEVAAMPCTTAVSGWLEARSAENLCESEE